MERGKGEGVYVFVSIHANGGVIVGEVPKSGSNDNKIKKFEGELKSHTLSPEI